MVLCNNLPKFEQEDHMLIVIYTNNIYFFSNVLVEWPPDKFTKSSVVVNKTLSHSVLNSC